MPIVGSFAGASARAYGLGAGVTGPGDFESIATTTVGAGGVSDVTFSTIPARYTHLQLRIMVQESIDTVAIEFNSDTANNYSRHYLEGDGGVATSGATSSTNMIFVATTYGSSGNNFGVAIVDILDYANTNKYKTVRSITGVNNNASFGKVILYSGNWRSTSAVTTIKVRSRTSGTLVQYSSFALYGVKA